MLKNLIKYTEKLFDFMASLKLAVTVILSLAIISSVGTIYESLYDREYAKKLVYDSVWMWLILALLAVNITAVMFDRWPWKKHHSAFVLAHIGILVLLFGSLVTYVYGIDGSMVFEIGGKNRYVQINSNEFAVYTSLNGKDYRMLHQEPVNFFNRDFKTNPYVIKLKDGDLQVLDYYHFAIPKREIIPNKAIQALPKSNAQDLSAQQNSSQMKANQPAVRFLLEGSRASQSSWLFKERMKLVDNFQMGPASVSLAGNDYKRVDKNEIIFRVKEDKLFYEVYKSGQEKPIKKGTWQEGEVIATGWMDFKIRVLKFYPNAKVQTTYTPRKTPSKAATSAIKLKYNDKVYQIGLNSPLKLFESDRVNVISWGNLRHDIGFSMTLEDFSVGRYQGSQQAKAYQSEIRVNNNKKLHTISMNEPFKKNGLTFYQSSFQQDESGKPTHSVLSVNKDPGRWIKYLGSFLIALGIIMLFYFKKVYAKPQKNRQD